MSWLLLSWHPTRDLSTVTSQYLIDILLYFGCGLVQVQLSWLEDDLQNCCAPICGSQTQHVSENMIALFSKIHTETSTWWQIWSLHGRTRKSSPNTCADIDQHVLFLFWPTTPWLLRRHAPKKSLTSTFDDSFSWKDKFTCAQCCMTLIPPWLTQPVSLLTEPNDAAHCQWMYLNMHLTQSMWLVPGGWQQSQCCAQRHPSQSQPSVVQPPYLLWNLVWGTRPGFQACSAWHDVSVTMSCYQLLIEMRALHTVWCNLPEPFCLSQYVLYNLSESM